MTEKQEIIFGHLKNSSMSKKEIVSISGMNIISVGLVLNNLVSDGLVANDNGVFSIISGVEILENVKEVKIVEKPNKSVELNKGKYSISIDEYDQNMFYELRNLGMTYNPSNYSFNTNDENIISEANEIINHYTCSPTNMTKSQRQFRDFLENNLNLDIFVKRVGEFIYISNTNGLGIMSEILKECKKKYSSVQKINENRIVIKAV